MTKIIARLVANENEWQQVQKIRREVFVNEQKVDENEEFDEFENIARHFIAFINEKACGAARWRFTEKGIKLERFAVSQEARSLGVGKALVQAVLDDIALFPETKNQTAYMHAQISAMRLYARFGFVAQGEQFDECGIAHYKMSKKL